MDVSIEVKMKKECQETNFTEDEEISALLSSHKLSTNESQAWHSQTNENENEVKFRQTESTGRMFEKTFATRSNLRQHLETIKQVLLQPARSVANVSS